MLQRQVVEPAEFTSSPTRAPTVMDRNVSEFCRRLVAGAIHGQQYAPAWAALALLFRACSVQFLRNHPVPLGARPDHSALQILEPRSIHLRLAMDGANTDAAHGLFAIARFVPRGVDAIVIVRKAHAFTEAERAWMELLLEHVRSALELGDELAVAAPTEPAAVHFTQLLPTPCILTDAEGRCVERNEAFGRLLELTSGAVRGGRVVFEDPCLQDSWQQALHEGSVTAAPQSLLATGAGGEAWTGHVVPFACVSSRVQGTPRHLMLVLFERTATSETRGLPASTLSPLTKAELEVLASLMLGLTAKVIASTRGASVNTVRSQIASILSKTGHHSQKTLIASMAMGELEGLLSQPSVHRR